MAGFVIDLQAAAPALEDSPVTVRDRHGRDWQVDPALATVDALWLLRAKDGQSTADVIERCVEIVASCVAPHHSDLAEALRTGKGPLARTFTTTEIVAVCTAFLARSGLGGRPRQSPATATRTSPARKKAARR